MGWKDKAEKLEKNPKGGDWRKKAESVPTAKSEPKPRPKKVKDEGDYLDKLESIISAGTSGLAQGASLGFADEIAGALRSAFGGGDYKSERDAVRTRMQEDEARAPTTALAGRIAGGLAAPGSALMKGAQSIPRLMGLGAAQGAAYGAGEAAEMENVPGAAVGGAALGGAVPGVIGAAGLPFRADPNKLREFADQQRIGQALKGLTSNQMQSAIDLPMGQAGLANRLREMGARGLRKSSDVQEDIIRQGDQASQEIGKILDKVNRGGGKVDVKATYRRLTKMARDAEATPSAEAAQKARAAKEAAERLEPYLEEGVGMKTAQRLKQSFQSDLASPAIDAQLSSRQAVAKQGAPSIRRGMLKAVKEYEEDLGKAYEKSLQDSQIGILARQAGGKEAGKAAALRTLTPSDYLAGAGGGATTGSSLGALVSAGLNRVLKGTEKGLAASGAERLEKALQSRPAAFGRYATKLENAAKLGRGALQASHFALYQSDPEYRKTVTALENEE